MGYIVKVLTNTFKETTVGTLNYSLNATNFIEKALLVLDVDLWQYINIHDNQ